MMRVLKVGKQVKRINGVYSEQMKKVNKQCLLDTPRTVRVSEKNLANYSSNKKTLVLIRRFQ